jgi:protease-4
MISVGRLNSSFRTLKLLACLALLIASPATSTPVLATQEPNVEEPQAEKNKNSAAASADARRQKVRYALFELDEELPESAGQAGLFGDQQPTLRSFVERIDKAGTDKSIAGAILRLRNPDFGPGKIEELRGAIARFRATGKKIHAELESAMPSDYLVACACDEIVIPESGELILPGVHAEAIFFKNLFNKVGVEADFVHIGAYKGAAEPLTQEKFSEPVRENMTALVDSMYDELVSTIVKHRPLSVAQAKEAIDLGMLSATRAKELGLVDRVAYSDELRKHLAELADADSVVYVKNYGQKASNAELSSPTGVLKLMQAMMGGDLKPAASRQKKIAIIYAVGPITSGESISDLFGEQVMGAATIVEALREAANDEHVVAIVLRVDSPGGSALASDLIWHETQTIEKPIVASMGDVAASGGYYISMGADKVFAAPGTLTGSIGVVGGKVALRDLFDKIGVTTETIQRGKNSGLFARTGKFSESERRVVLDSMETVYEQFTEKAAKGRNMPIEKLRELAGGRVYTGRQAKEIGLVDELGPLHDAILAAKALAGLQDDDEVTIESLPEPKSILDSLFRSSEGEKELSYGRHLELLAPELAVPLRKAYRLQFMFQRPTALIMPFELEIR